MKVADGANTAVMLATLPADCPTGQFFHMGERLPWQARLAFVPALIGRLSPARMRQICLDPVPCYEVPVLTMSRRSAVFSNKTLDF